MNHTTITIFAFCIFPALSLKILSIKDVEKGQHFNITIKNPPQVRTSQFSFCWWVKLGQRGIHTYLGNNDPTYIQIWDDYGNGKILWVNNIWDIRFPAKLQILPHTWTFFCIICDKNERTFEFYINAIRIYKEEMSMFFDNVDWETEFLRNNIKFIGESSPHNITGLSVWSGDLTEEDITSLYTCKKQHSYADIMTWDAVEFDILPKTNTIQMLETEDEEEPCKEQTEFYYVPPILSGMNNKKEASRKCFALGGKMDMFADENEMKAFKYDSAHCSEYLWAPAFRIGDGWVDNHNNHAKYLPWKENEPIKPDQYRCVFIEDKKYLTEDCSYQLCFYCKMKKHRLFRLRGGCKSFSKKIDIDDEYIFLPNKVVNTKPMWLGTQNSIIKWNNNKAQWEICDLSKDECYVKLILENNFPIGKHYWYLFDGISCKDSQNGEELEMILTACDVDEFTCNDGTCIDVSKKCDFVNDCFDSSDEKMCDVLSMKHYGTDYNPAMPDISFGENKNIIPATVNVSMRLIGISKIKEIDMQFSAKLKLDLDWIDTRLTWMNLYKDKSLNMLFGYEKSMIWTPEIIFVNTENEETTKADNSSKITIDKISSFELDELDLHETAYFPGSENPLTYSRIFSLDFKCSFELRRYPFDTQTCEIEMAVTFAESKFVRLIPSKLQYIGPVEMLTYSVVDFDIGVGDVPPASLKVTIQLKRMVSQHLLSTYLPSLCILVIAQVFRIKLLLFMSFLFFR